MTRNRQMALCLSLAIVTALAQSTSGQPVPLSQRTGGVLVGDMTLDQVYLTRDLNNDGDAADPGEATVYFDGLNASGLPNPTGTVLAIFQSTSGHQFIGDSGTDTVYRLMDINGDGDAQDPGEATVWFSLANAGGLTLPTPNGVFQDTSGATYIANAGVSSAPADAVYRTVDLNNDGDANDMGEASLWFDLQLANPSSSAFDLTFLGDVAYIADLVGGNPDTVYRAEDANGNGSIEVGEFGVFIDDGNSYGVPVATAVVTDGTSLYVSESSSSALQSVYRLTDLDGSGHINSAAEATEVWNESWVPTGVSMGFSYGLAIGPGGELSVGSAGSTLLDNIFRLVDLNGDGDFLDPGETILWANGGAGSGQFIDNPRSLEYVLGAGAGVLLGDMNCDGTVDIADTGPFALALVDPAGYSVVFPSCDITAADINGDLLNNGSDVAGFAACVIGGGCP